MTKFHFWSFFYHHGGKLKRPVTKPRLTPEHMKNRVIFAKRWLEKLESNEELYYCFLDEKWFYTTSRRKKMKMLPKASFETFNESHVKYKKIRNRRHPCKVMFMGIVAPPIEGKMDGNILLQRVSKKIATKRRSMNQKFSTYFENNNRIKSGQWRSLYPTVGDISISDFMYLIATVFELDEAVGERLVLSYHTHIMTKKTNQIKRVQKTLTCDDGLTLQNRMLNDKKNGELVPRMIKLADLNLRVQIPCKELVDRDVSCDSVFMMDNMHLIGKSIRDAYSFLDSKTPVYLFMDNAGGHGKTVVKAAYMKILKDSYNVHIEWQVPHSPETNMLDLGVWMALQSRVEDIHKRKVMKHDDLAKSVETAFGATDQTMLIKVHDRWKLVLRLIIAGNGTNELVEKCRGLKVDLSKLPSFTADTGNVEAVHASIADAAIDSDCDDEWGDEVGADENS